MRRNDSNGILSASPCVFRVDVRRGGEGVVGGLRPETTLGGLRPPSTLAPLDEPKGVAVAVAVWVCGVTK